MRQHRPRGWSGDGRVKAKKTAAGRVNIGELIGKGIIVRGQTPGQSMKKSPKLTKTCPKSLTHARLLGFPPLGMY